MGDGAVIDERQKAISPEELHVVVLERDVNAALDVIDRGSPAEPQLDVLLHAGVDGIRFRGAELHQSRRSTFLTKGSCGFEIHAGPIEVRPGAEVVSEEVVHVGIRLLGCGCQ